ncbi:MAG: SMC-Scp complex subunit ScpB [Kiritimatiellia bacterium]
MSKSDGLLMASSLQQVVGALIFGANRALTIEEIRKCLITVAQADTEKDETVKLFAETSPREIRDVVEGIAKEFSRINIGVALEEVNGAFRFQTQAASGRWLRNLLKADRPNRLSRPALETLAIIAYRQPVSKSEIVAIRGVTIDHIIKILMELHLIRIVGRSELPGRPFLYGTTPTFLEHFGLSSLKELNELEPTLQRSKKSERMALHTKSAEKEGESNESAPSLFDQTQEAADKESLVEEILMRNVEASEAAEVEDEEEV